MNNFLLVITIIVSILIIVLTLFQGKGDGLGSAWGGGGGNFQTRRGVEQVMLKATAVLVAIFFVLAVINLVLN